MNKDDCLFCQIATSSKDLLVYEDNNTVAFLDIYPAAQAHILVIPKKHYDTWVDTNENDIANVSLTAHKITKKLLEIYPSEIEGFNMLVNNGKAANQVIFHYHMHIIPKFINTNNKHLQHLVDEQAQKKLDETRKLLKQKLV